MEERGSLNTQLKNTRTLLAAKSDERKEATEILKRCKEDRAVYRAKVDAQVSERNESTRELMDQWSTNRPQIEQTKRALACLMTTKEKIEIVEKTVLKEKMNKKNKKKNIEEMEVTTKDSKRVELVAELEVDSVNTKEENMMSEMFIPLMDEEMEEQDTHSKEMHKTKQELCDMQKKLGETIASLTEEENVANAKIKAELDEERFNVNQASQEAESKLQKHVALLISVSG
ncbi:hypothetical protein PsorP6_009802 [Peronosclerospora sorghi]|uniref:Uncharacterized protein n=1 Tax=Peronosclerospora sorghi TaxID=230839 RepID=A0ACC0VZC3_9STRA|nr:hypothetical protein PsorP6_009802 [Peronosclerospora sorghi]